MIALALTAGLAGAGGPSTADETAAPSVVPIATSSLFKVMADDDALVRLAQDWARCRFGKSSLSNGVWVVKLHFSRCEDQACVGLTADFRPDGSPDGAPPAASLRVDRRLPGSTDIGAVIARTDAVIAGLAGAHDEKACVGH